MEKYEYLKNAELIHEEIERIYNPGVDFAGVYALAEAHIKSLLAMRKLTDKIKHLVPVYFSGSH